MEFDHYENTDALVGRHSVPESESASTTEDEFDTSEKEDTKKGKFFCFCKNLS